MTAFVQETAFEEIQGVIVLTIPNIPVVNIAPPTSEEGEKSASLQGVPKKFP